MRKVRFTFLAGVWGVMLLGGPWVQAQTKAPGLALTFAAGAATDATVVSNALFYVSANQAPTPFLPPGPFTARLDGFIAVDLRGDYAFQAELNGALKLEINGQTLLAATTNGIVETSKTIRLGKGATNVLTAAFTSPAQGDAFLRLRWKPSDSFFHPIPHASLSHTPTAEEQKAEQVRSGRELFLEHRCAKCHAGPKPESAIPELAMDAPAFANIGARRNAAWMARWILDPKALRPTAHMPKLRQGEKAPEDAAAMAAYLSSLQPAGFKAEAQAAAKDPENAGEKLFATLQCAACHDVPDGGATDEKKISLRQASAKFAPGALADFLKQPNAHYAWIRMPQFKLTDEQRGQIALYILAKSEVPKGTAAASPEMIAQGQKLVQTSGCLHCHSLPLENQFSAPTLADLRDGQKGCLAETPGEKAAHFGFTAEQRAALRAFIATDRAALERHVPADFAARHTRLLHCRNCHGQAEGFPALEILGGKLKPEWMEKFIAGESGEKPRPWLATQMPGFPKYAAALAPGLAAQHGLPPQTPAEPAIEAEAAKVGCNLVSSPPLGFSCISCHAVGAVGATQVFEAPGINLALSGERLQPDFFRRWLRNPPLVDPQSKMPVYFDEQGKSPFTEVYEGDGGKQIHALWQYLRLGPKMPAPKTD